ncbi:MAG TPA: hypothetical protein VJN89_14480 [Candidatus Acidoferrum sp.]|nr:hypothetical protein [Candidatus Acidoferrum sp.]
MRRVWCAILFSSFLIGCLFFAADAAVAQAVNGAFLGTVTDV